MSNTVIQIKRSTTTAVPNDLQPGELAYTSNGQVLFIGSPVGTNTANVIAIAGERSPGVLTANQALIANASSWIDNIQTAKLIIGTTGTTANITAFTTDGTLSGANVSNSTIMSSWAIKDYVDNNSASNLSGLDDVDTTGIANNTYLVYDNTASKWEPHTISGTVNEVDVSFSNNDLTIGLPSDVTIGANLTVTNHLSTNTANVTDTTASSNTTTGALKVAGGVGINGKLNVTEAAFGNTTNYTSINATAVGANNFYATDTVNAAILSVGGWVVANNSGVFTSGVVNADIVQVGTNFKANTTQLTVATFTDISNNVNVSGTVNAAAGFNAGANVNITTSSISVGNATVNAYITPTSISVDGTLDAGNTTIDGFANVTGTLQVGGLSSVGNVNVTGTVNASAGFNSGANISISTTELNIGNSSVNTFANSSTVRTGTLNVNDINATGNLSFGGNLIANGNVVLGNNSSDNISIVGYVNTSIIPAANVTYDIGTASLRFTNVYASHVDGVTGNFSGDLTVGGNVYVTGDLVSINVSTLAVEDSLIQLATNNTVADTIDIGFYGNYSNGSSPHQHSGLFRDASDDGIYKLFQGLTEPPTTTVDTANATFAIATLQAYLKSGGLVSNATHVAITANSTVNVAIVANTLSLSTALTVPNGGTGGTTFANNGVLLGNDAGTIGVATVGSNGQVLKVVGGTPQFAHLDGGTF